MYERIECNLCGRKNLSNVRKCVCGNIVKEVTANKKSLKICVNGCEIGYDSFWEVHHGKIMCRDCSDNWILEMLPDSTAAFLIKDVRSKNKGSHDDFDIG